MAERSYPVLQQVQTEQEQAHETRRSLYARLEEELGRPVVSFFTSFLYPVIIDDSDADMLEGVLQAIDVGKGFALMISSPGGDGLAAERIVNICRNYSGTGEYWTIVPGKAKSAATVVCFGSSKILMGPNSELGPVDPQVPIVKDHELPVWVAAFNLVKSYEDLFQRAVNENGRLEPYLLQLERYDERIIQEYKAAIELSKDISLRALATGMMKRYDVQAREEKIRIFLTPEWTKTHGRPIYRTEARKCGLKIDFVSPKSEVWNLIYELYVRMSSYTSNNVSKCIESADLSFTAGVRQRGSEND